ncbi:hypothetical protein EVAR_43970_1 [Eumeta japonica]|uniref:Ig-like domain-containing protein n=1 Tax=Eumeta variegata TaxID=151549 RepID=A0A4C1XYF9_EUMVA|nr:hypothetical protein EVAR_43970_1 [Eumeta japonica]
MMIMCVCRLYNWSHGVDNVNAEAVTYTDDPPRTHLERLCETVSAQSDMSKVDQHSSLLTAMEEQFEVQPSNKSAPSRQPLALACRIPSTPPAALLWSKDGRTLTNHHR